MNTWRWGLRLFTFGIVGLAIASVVAIPSTADPHLATPPVSAANHSIDLDVTFINRAPLYKAYCVQYLHDAPNQPGRPYLCPGTEDDRRWPAPGEIVTFTAHIVNKGTVASPAFDYAWHIDGTEVASGTLPALAPAAEVTATYQWPWGHALSSDGQRALGEHTVRFTADPANLIAETYESNNSLEDRTNAMSFSIYITPEMYEAYNTPVDPKYPYSAEDWLQKQIAAMNTAFANSVYPVTPQGAPLRVRINTIGIAPAAPPPDGAHDGGWFVDADYRHGASSWYDPATDIDWGLIHELSHQVSLIDLYAIGVYAANVFVTGNDGMPSNFGFGWSNGGLMGGGDTSPHNDPHLYSSHSAGGASTFAGYRNGYYGSYLFDIPLQNYLRVLDNQGNPAADVQIALYQRTGPWDWTGQMGVDAIQEISGTTDSAGIFPLPNRSANGGTITQNGHVLHDNPFGAVDIIGNQGLFLVSLARQDHEEFHWLDITQFNLAYWMGDTISHTFTISSHVPPANAPVAPQLRQVRIEGTLATLDWYPVPGAAGYRVYRATPPDYRYIVASDGLTTTTYEEWAGAWEDGQHRIYVVTAVDGAERESAFSAPAYAPTLSPRAVALDPNGARTVLNNWNMYPLLRQQPDGRYTHRLVNVHYDLGSAADLAYGIAGPLVVSGFGQFPGDVRRAVRAYDAEMQPLWAFGEEGTAPGQFVAPSGVATWGPPCTYGGRYNVDAHTSLLLHFDGDFTGAEGEIGTATGVTFTTGRYEQGVSIDADDTLTYTTAGNLNRTQGAIEFWLRPNWPGNDEQSYTFFEVGAQWFNRMRIMKDGANNLRFLLWDSTTEYGVAHNIGHWQAGEWHHVAVTWQGTDIALYVDGVQVASDGNARPPDTLAAEMYVGSASWEGYQANAVIDELRISDIPRLGNSDACMRILVADSAAHRIQAFDSLGNLLSAYGDAPGTLLGQFDTPQDVAVDKSGRVIVVDQGNDRLVVLNFDGQTLSHRAIITAGLSSPTGIAVDAADNLYIADTGNNRIVVLDAAGGFLAEYTAPNDGYPGPFNAPRGVAVEADGDIVVADTGNGRVVTIRNLTGWHNVYLPLVCR
ncbi:MAG TPA: CARDB domain-containing protein [Anaerolineae bacterium]|nr:CARDB domain-containing protein [Anaerolineae bacterium]HQK14752.1 CARDB domain-containing protein [Anaerolineae bacterium]